MPRVDIQTIFQSHYSVSEIDHYSDQGAKQRQSGIEKNQTEGLEPNTSSSCTYHISETTGYSRIQDDTIRHKEILDPYLRETVDKQPMGVKPDARDGLPYLIIIVTLVLCSLLLATIALIIVVVVIRQKRRQSRSDSIQDEAIAYDMVNKPETKAMEVQPDLRNLEPRGDPRAFMPFAPIPTRRYTSLPFESQRRLIPVPEEEGSADERLTSPEEIFSFPMYAMVQDDEFGPEGPEGDLLPLPASTPPDVGEDMAIATEVREKT